MKAKQEFSDQQGTDMLWLCRRISDLCAHLRIGEAERPDLTDHGIVEVPDSQILATHAFTQDVQRNLQGRPGRIKRLITEVTTLKTGLASGIWVKHAESRLDVMK